MNVLDMNSLKSMVRVTCMDRVRNKEVHRRYVMKMSFTSRADVGVSSTVYIEQRNSDEPSYFDVSHSADRVIPGSSWS